MGIALDSKARCCDDDFSIREYCVKEFKNYAPSCCTDTTVEEGMGVKRDESTSVWSCLHLFSFQTPKFG